MSNDAGSIVRMAKFLTTKRENADEKIHAKLGEDPEPQLLLRPAYDREDVVEERGDADRAVERA